MKSSPSKLLSPKFISMIGVLFILAIYFLGMRLWLPFSAISTIEIIMIVVLAVLTVGTLLFSLVSLLALVFSKNRGNWSKRLRGQMIFLFGIVLLLSVIVGASQWLAHTPPILGADGKALAQQHRLTGESSQLGGVDQWLIIRGQDVNKPVLLFLSGGPGASEAARVLRFNRNWRSISWSSSGNSAAVANPIRRSTPNPT